MTTSAPTVAAATTSATSPSSNASAVVNTMSNGLHTPNAAIAAVVATSAAQLQPPPQQQQQQQQQQQTPRAMQSDEDFNIRFVNLVRTHKCLYDKKVPEYRNRDNQEKAWSLISQETRESVIHCKERWRNLRACLSRYIKQQSGSDPQHKPYYLTEHMAFLLPFLKSTRNSLDQNNLISLFQPHRQTLSNSSSMHLLAQSQMHFKGEQLDIKTSMSDHEDEETIDAFDPVVAASIHQMQQQHHQHHQQQQHQQHHQQHQRSQTPLSDTVSANTMQNFIPDVQLAELRCDVSAGDISFVTAGHHNNQQNQSMSDLGHEPKRIKTEPVDGEGSHHNSMHSMYSAENSDMEFFRSILPDIAALTSQQKRKFKIGILELIDEVIERYPAEGRNGVTLAMSSSNRPSRRNSVRDWRK